MAASILLLDKTTAGLQAILQVYVAKNKEKKRKPKILASLMKAAFPASFTESKDHQNRNFMVNNTIVILLLLG